MPMSKINSMSRVSSRGSFVDPISPLTLPALDAFLGIDARASPPPPTSLRGRRPPSRSLTPEHDPRSPLTKPTGTGRKFLAPPMLSVLKLARDATAAADGTATPVLPFTSLSEAFAAQRQRRLRDAKRRLRGIQAAEEARAAMQARRRAECFVTDAKRTYQAGAAEARFAAHVTDVRERHFAKLRRAEERRTAAAEARLEALRAREAHRLEVLARTAAMKSANTVLGEPDARSAGAALWRVATMVNASLHAAAHTHAIAPFAATNPGSPVGTQQPVPPAPPQQALLFDASRPFTGRVRRFHNELFGRAAHSNALRDMEDIIVADPFRPCAACGDATPSREHCRVTGVRHAQLLPEAAGHLLELLLAAARAPPTPDASPSKAPHESVLVSPLAKSVDSAASGDSTPTAEARPAVLPSDDASPDASAYSTSTTDPSAASLSSTSCLGGAVHHQWPRLEDPAVRDIVTRQLIGAHYAAVEHLAPRGMPGSLRPCPEQQHRSHVEAAQATYTADRLVGAMALTLCRELHQMLALLAPAATPHGSAPSTFDGNAAASSSPAMPTPGLSVSSSSSPGGRAATVTFESAAGARTTEGDADDAEVRSSRDPVPLEPSTPLPGNAAGRVTHRRVLKLLSAWDAYCTLAAEEERRKKRAALDGLTEAYVQLRVAEVARGRDIDAKRAAAAAAPPRSARALRERMVGPRRMALTQAVTSQLASLQRKLRAIGGEDAVAAADRRAESTIADFTQDMAAHEARAAARAQQQRREESHVEVVVA